MKLNGCNQLFGGDWLVALTKREKYILSKMSDCCLEHEINKYERTKEFNVISVIQECSRSLFIYGIEKGETYVLIAQKLLSSLLIGVGVRVGG